MNDILGSEISVGDYVAYATRVGNSGELLVGKVLEADEESCTVIAGRAGWKNKPLDFNTRKSVWTNASNLIRLEGILTLPTIFSGVRP